MTHDLSKQQVMAGVIGHAIGDALGVPVEFQRREALQNHPIMGMEGFGTHNVPAGTWSDDTSMELCLMQSLIDQKKVDLSDIMDNFVRWAREDAFTATGRCFDIGGTCSMAISNYEWNQNPLECGQGDEYSNGNGSLMRILPVAFLCYKYELATKQTYNLVRDISALTHAHEVSVLGCYIYTKFVEHLLSGDSKEVAYEKVRHGDYSMFSRESLLKYRRILVDNITECAEDDISSSGYVLHSLEAALWSLLTTENYREAVLTAVNLGNDTDTVGAITGSMAGICYGYDSIPTEWIKKLQRHDYLEKICEEFADAQIDI